MLHACTCVCVSARQSIRQDDDCDDGRTAGHGAGTVCCQLLAYTLWGVERAATYATRQTAKRQATAMLKLATDSHVIGHSHRRVTMSHNIIRRRRHRRTQSLYIFHPTLSYSRARPADRPGTISHTTHIPQCIHYMLLLLSRHGTSAAARHNWTHEVDNIEIKITQQ